jgi:hypothetical protein
MAISLSVSSGCTRHQRAVAPLRRQCERVHLVPVIVGYWQTATPLHSVVISTKHFAQQTAVIFGQRLTCFRTSSFNSPHSSQRSNTRTCIGRLCHFSSGFMSGALALVCGVDGEDVRPHPPQFCGRRIISAQLEQISCVLPHRGPHWIQMLPGSTTWRYTFLFNQGTNVYSPYALPTI